jgi:polysaccharide biosynthesis transport protein
MACDAKDRLMALTTKPESSESAEPKRAGALSGRLVLHAIRRRPLAFLGVLLLGGSVGAGVWFFLPLPKVTAAVVFQVASRTPSILERTSSEGDASFLSYKQSQAALVKRRLTLNTALNQPGIKGLGVFKGIDTDELSWLDQKMKVDTKTGSEFMRVSIEGDNGDELQTLLEAISKAYLADVDERHNGERRRRRDKLEDTRRSYQAELDRFHRRIDSIALAIGSKDGPTLVALDAIQQAELRDASRDRSVVRDDLRLAESELEALGGELRPKSVEPPAALAAVIGPPAHFVPAPRIEEPADNIIIPRSMIDEAIRDDPAMRTLDAEVEAAQKHLTKTQAFFEKGATSPALTKAKDDLKAAEAKRDKYRIERRPEIEARLKEKHRSAADTRRSIYQDNVKRLRRKEELAQKKVEDVEIRIARSNQYRVELENIKRQIEQTEKLNTTLGDQIEHIKVELGAPARVSMAEEPFVVPGIEGNRRLKYALMGGVGMFLVGFAGLVGWEARGRRVTHTDDVTTSIGVRLLGTLPPSYPGANDPQAAAMSRVLVEAVDTARTMLLHGTPAGAQLRTLLITSAVAREGKTSLSGHLAISLARAGFRTILIDGDLQAPSAHRIYNLPEGPGLCELLRGECDSSKAARLSPIPGLSVMSAGRWDIAARQALVGDRWRRLRKELEGRFDYLVIDTAPLLLVSDTLLLAREVDGVVLSVLLGVSQVAHVIETVDKLRAIGVNLTGAVVNGVWHKAYRPGYGYRSAEPAREDQLGVNAESVATMAVGKEDA